MQNLLPFFEVEGKKYEIKPTRYLWAEFDKLTRENAISDDEKKAALLLKEEADSFQKIKARYKEAETAYLENPIDSEKEELYEKYKVIYEKRREQFYDKVIVDKSIEKMNKSSVDNLEAVLMLALQEQYSLSEKDSKSAWESYVDEIGAQTASEWLIAMGNCLFAEKEDENSFLEKMRQKEAEKQKRFVALKTKK